MVIDAGAAVKWFIDEPRHDVARGLLHEDVSRYTPDLILHEVANAMRRKHRLGEVSIEQAEAALADLATYFKSLTSEAETLRDAFRIGRELDHATMDCTYLALAFRIHGLLVTDDGRFVQKCRGSGYASSVLLLADWPGQRVGLH